MLWQHARHLWHGRPLLLWQLLLLNLWQLLLLGQARCLGHLLLLLE
jgi:hypothetical protein